MSAPSPDRRVPWHEVGRHLTEVAMGRKKADLVIRNGTWVNVHTAEVIPGIDVAVAGARIAYVGPDAGHAVGRKTRTFDAGGRFLVPGLCDSHMHVESGMVTVTEFCRAVIPHGTTSMFVDPHEIANVLGLEGVRVMHDEALTMPVGIYVQVPSCVPSAPGFEDAGAVLGPDDVAEALTWPGTIGLGEMMSFPEIAGGDADKHAIVAATMKAGKTVGGHLPIPADNDMFHGYVAGGPADDHEVTTREGALERARRGMRAMCRYGSAWLDIAETVRAVTENGADARNFSLCTDDCHPGTLVHEGHMNRVVRHAIERGVRPVTAIQMATLNTAEHFGVARDVGSITPGRIADMIITSDLVELPIEQVFAAGELVAEGGKLTADISRYKHPKSVLHTMNIGSEIEPSLFRLDVPDGKAEANVIGVIENQAPTKALRMKVGFKDGALKDPLNSDVAQVSVIFRHGDPRDEPKASHGLVSGFRLHADCAIATTVMHDCHNLLVVGTCQENMALAAEHLREIGGGVAVYVRGKLGADVPLPIAGLMSDKRAEEVADEAKALIGAMAECGCSLNNAYMQLSLLGLTVIPELRISNRGIVDVLGQSVVSLCPG